MHRITSYNVCYTKLLRANNDGDRGLITDLESAILVNMYGVPVMKYVPFKAYFGQNFSGGAEGDKFGMLVITSYSIHYTKLYD